MVNVIGLGAGLLITSVGWIFVRNPQVGFRIHNWPLVSSGTDGLTDAGKLPYRVRGVFVILLGLLITVVAVLD